jgi:hypothetical protein
MLQPAQLIQFILMLAVAMPPLPSEDCCCARARQGAEGCCRVKKLAAAKSPVVPARCPRCLQAAQQASQSPEQSGPSVSRLCQCEKELRESPRLTAEVRNPVRRDQSSQVLFAAVQPALAAAQVRGSHWADLPPPAQPLSVQVMFCVLLI